jgi:hypothetical protein
MYDGQWPEIAEGRAAGFGDEGIVVAEFVFGPGCSGSGLLIRTGQR